MARFTKSEVVSRHAGRGALMQRLMLGLLFLFGVGLLLLSRMNHPSVQQARTQMMASIAPVVQVVNAPVETVRHVLSDWQALLNAHSMNAQLQAENDALRHWQSVAVTLAQENEALKTLSHYKPVKQTAYISAKVIAAAQTAFSQELWINVGAEDGVKPYQPVIDASGLIGRTVEVSGHASRLMLVTNPNSRIPVMVGTSGTRAIVTGAADGGLQLIFAPLTHSIKPGDLVVTSEDGGLMPEAIAIGKVQEIQGRRITVAPMRPVQQPGYVRVVQYSAPHADVITPRP